MDETVVKDPGSDSSANSQTGQTTAESQATQAAQPPVVPQEDYRNLQSFATRTSQELKSLKEQIAQRDEESKTKAREYEETVTRLRQAFAPETAQPQLDPAQVSELDRLFQQTPTYKSLSEQTKAQQLQQQTAMQGQHTVAVNEAAVALEQKYKLDADTGNKLKDYIQSRPYLLYGVQSAATKEQAQMAFEDAYKAYHYDTLQKNAVELGTKTVEQNLKAMEATTAVEQPGGKPAAAEAAGIAYVRGQGLDGVWDKIAANTRQQLGV